jgi:predicted outer membrane protein
MCTFRSLLVAGLILGPLAVLAQETGQREREKQPGRDPAARKDSRTETRTEIRTHARPVAQSGQLNKFFVSCLRSDNQGEITIAKLAETKASHPEVKAFAQQMVKDHTDFLAKLDRLNEGDSSPAGAATSRTESRTEIRTENRRADAKDQPGATPRRDATDRPDATDKARRDRDPGARADVRVDTTRGDVTVAAGGRGTGVDDQLIRVKQEISDRCLASAQKELNAKEGKDFDKCFMFMQVGGHMHMVDTLSVLKNHATGELQQVIEEGLQTSQQHLEHAKQLAKKIDTNDSSESSTTTERRTERPAKESGRTEGERRPSDKPGSESGKTERSEERPK